MPGKEKQAISPNEAVLPKELSSDRSAEGRERGRQTVLAKLQEQGAVLLKKLRLDGSFHLERLGLADNREAEQAVEKYDARRQETMKRIREKLVIAATLAMLTMGTGKALGAELGDLEKGFQSVHTEQSVLLEEEILGMQALQPPIQESIGEITAANEADMEEGQSDDLVLVQGWKMGQEANVPTTEKPLSADEKELRKISQAVSDIMNACMGLQKDNCLLTVTQATMKHVVLDSLIPFKRGLTRLKEAADGEKMEAGERFGKVVSGIFDLLTDAATIHIGGKGVIKLAQLYRAYQGVTSATAAYTFYVENKKDVLMALKTIFGGASSEQQAVENTLATLEKVGQISEDTPASIQTN